MKLGIALGLVLGACSVDSLGPRRAAHQEFFLRQRIHPEGGKAASGAPGLDSQEAAIIADSYRTGLAPDGARVQEEPLLILAPGEPNQPRTRSPRR